jgi:hypothetical protein
MKKEIGSITSVTDEGAVNITYNFNKDSKLFDSGDFVKNWYDCNKFKMHLDKREFDFKDDLSIEEYALKHSLVETRLAQAEGGWVLDYDNKKTWRSVLYYVAEGTNPTWEELRKICEDEDKSNIR